MPTPATILSLAPGAGYLSANAVRGSVLFNRGRLNPILPQQIYALYFILKKIYDKNPNQDGLVPSCNYLWEIMGRYGVAAEGLVGGGSVSPVTPGTAPSPIEFVVSGSSFMVNGQSTATLPITFVGYNLIFIRNNIPQSTVNNGGTYYSWDKNSVQFQCVGAAVTDELFQLIPYI